MERPKVDIQPKQRDITGEIVYLDAMRQQNEEPVPFTELGELAIGMYEAKADIYTIDGVRPDILDEYEKHDNNTQSEVIKSCIALADELLKLKTANSPLTYVDIVVEATPEAVLTKLGTISAGSILSGDNEQLAIQSNGEYYPIIEIHKNRAKFTGVGLRVWGWEHDKYVATNKLGEPYEYPQHALIYPSYEKSSSRQLELSFGYDDEVSGRFSESISLYISADDTASIGSRIWAEAYAETGYEGHGGSILGNLTDNDIAEFGDLIAEIVGENPLSIPMKINHQLQELTEAAATPSAKQAIHDLIGATWPVQANYLLSRCMEGEDKTIAMMLQDKASADKATDAINALMEEYKRH